MEERDLVILFRNNLKPSSQFAASAAKARSVYIRSNNKEFQALRQRRVSNAIRNLHQTSHGVYIVNYVYKPLKSAEESN